MIKKIIPAFFCMLSCLAVFSQRNTDSVVQVGKNTITLSEVVINNKLNVPVFIERIKNDTSFHKAFKNLHIIGFTAINDIRMNDAEGKPKATLKSKTRQTREGNCRKMKVLDETVTGDMYDENHQFNYYTAQMYASLFFTKDSVCGENNIVAGSEISTSGKSGMEKHKEQLKMLFFNPGKRIGGLPFISNKTAIFDDDMADRYDINIDFALHNNTSCYVLTQKVKPTEKNGVVLDEMITWFDDKTMDVVARNYSLSYRAGVYDFDVQMQVEMARFGELTVPSLIRYHGNWKAVFKKRERGIFTATLFDFKN